MTGPADPAPVEAIAKAASMGQIAHSFRQLFMPGAKEFNAPGWWLQGPVDQMLTGGRS